MFAHVGGVPSIECPSVVSRAVTSCVSDELTDAPSIPTRPEVVDSENEFILLKWQRPVDDGGTEILGYNIERKDPLSNRWVKLNSQLLTVINAFMNYNGVKGKGKGTYI